MRTVLVVGRLHLLASPAAIMCMRRGAITEQNRPAHMTTVRPTAQLRHPPDGRDMRATFVGREIARTTRNSILAHTATLALLGLLGSQLVREGGYWLVLGAALAAWSFCRLVLAIQRRALPVLHPIARRLAVHGDVTDQAKELDVELNPDPDDEMSNLRIPFLGAMRTLGFLIAEGRYNTMILPDKAVLWVVQTDYPNVRDPNPAVRERVPTRHPRPTRRDHQLPGDEAAVNEALNTWTDITPYLLTDYDKGLAKLFRTEAGRAEAEQKVAARREAWLRFRWTAPSRHLRGQRVEALLQHRRRPRRQ